MTGQELQDKFERAQQALNHADFPSALALLEEIVVEDSGHAEAWCHMGVCYLEMRRPDMALEALRRALDADPHHITAHLVMGHACGTTGQLENAAACYRRVLEIDPQHARAEEFLIRTQALLESRQHYRAALQLLTLPQPSTDDLNQAMRHLVQSAAIFQDSPARENLLECARMLAARKTDWEIPFEAGPDLMPWTKSCQRGQFCVQFENWRGAADAFSEALNYRARDAFVHHALGFSFIELGEVENAVRAWLRVLELDPGYDFTRFGRLNLKPQGGDRA